MAIRETIQIGHPALKAINQEIVDFADPKLTQLVQDLRETMYSAGLIGIAAPQIGENFRVFITEPRETESRPADQADEFRVYINPVIVGKSKDEVIIWEGCGSVLEAALFGPVKRPREVEVEAYDIKAKKFRFRADGILRRVIQHESDHLDGIEFIEIVADYKLLKSKKFYIKDEKNRQEHLKAQKITIKQYHEVRI